MKPALKDLLTRSTFTSRFDKNLFDDISWSCGNLQNHHDVATALKGKNPHTITVLNEPLKYEYRNRREYVKKTKITINSKYRELLYHYFFEEYGESEGNELYGQWLDKYRPLQNVPSYLFLYTMENELLFIKRFNSLCVPRYDIGANYYLERSEEEILKQGGIFLRWNLLDEIKEIDIVS